MTAVKALKIDGAEATAENIKDGNYKDLRPFNIATKKGADNELAKDFISYIMSKEGQEVVSDNGYIPVMMQKLMQEQNHPEKL